MEDFIIRNLDGQPLLFVILVLLIVYLLYRDHQKDKAYLELFTAAIQVVDKTENVLSEVIDHDMKNQQTIKESTHELKAALDALKTSFEKINIKIDNITTQLKSNA